MDLLSHTYWVAGREAKAYCGREKGLKHHHFNLGSTKPATDYASASQAILLQIRFRWPPLTPSETGAFNPKQTLIASSHQMRTHREHTHTHTRIHAYTHILSTSMACTAAAPTRSIQKHIHEGTQSTFSQPQTIKDQHTGLCQFHLHPFQAINQDTESRKCCVANRFWGKNDTSAGVKRQHTMWPSLRLSQTTSTEDDTAVMLPVVTAK